MLMWSIMRSEIVPFQQGSIDPEHVRPHGSVGARNMNPDQEVCMELDKEACFAYLDEIAANLGTGEAEVTLDDARFVASKFSLSVKTAELVVRQWLESRTTTGKPVQIEQEGTGAVQISMQLINCGECCHVDHSGAFTKGGARSICGHSEATETLQKLGRLRSKKSFKRAYPEYAGDVHEYWEHHWFHRTIDRDGPIVAWCPLKHGARY